MKKIIALIVLTVVISSFVTTNDFFTGKIIYKFSYTDLKGNDITEKVAPILGLEQYYFINSKNYKAHDGKNNWVQLYNSETNTYYYFGKDKTAKKYDGAQASSKKFVVTKLNKKEIVAGYNCQCIQVDTDNETIIYYFSPNVRIDYPIFSKHNFGEWNKYLQATNGALSLKFVLTDHKNGFIWTSTATEITKQNLTDKDFLLPSDVIVKE